MSLGDGLARALQRYMQAKDEFGLRSLLVGDTDKNSEKTKHSSAAESQGRANGNGNGNGKKENGKKPGRRIGDATSQLICEEQSCEKQKQRPDDRYKFRNPKRFERERHRHEDRKPRVEVVQTAEVATEGAV